MENLQNIITSNKSSFIESNLGVNNLFNNKKPLINEIIDSFFKDGAVGVFKLLKVRLNRKKSIEEAILKLNDFYLKCVNITYKTRGFNFHFDNVNYSIDQFGDRLILYKVDENNYYTIVGEFRNRNLISLKYKAENDREIMLQFFNNYF